MWQKRGTWARPTWSFLREQNCSAFGTINTNDASVYFAIQNASTVHGYLECYRIRIDSSAAMQMGIAIGQVVGTLTAPTGKYITNTDPLLAPPAVALGFGAGSDFGNLGFLDSTISNVTEFEYELDAGSFAYLPAGWAVCGFFGNLSTTFTGSIALSFSYRRSQVLV